jgi:hypothetical protein
VLVTGTPRSGTTPVGDALAAAPGARTLYEPLNFHVGDRRISRYFEVPGAAGFSDATADALVHDIRALRLRLRPGLFPEDQGLRRLVKHVTGSRTLATYRQCRLDPALRTIVWKDPFATFLAPRVARDHGIPVVITVRPPAAVAASFKRLSWGFDTADLVARLGPQGEPYRDLVARVTADRPAHNGAVLWHVVNDWLLRSCADIPNMHVVDLEQLVQHRTATLRWLYAELGLTWGPAIERHLRRTAGGDGPATPTSGRAHDAKRDPAAVNTYWADVLDPHEVAFVEEINAELWERVQATAVTTSP